MWCHIDVKTRVPAINRPTSAGSAASIEVATSAGRAAVRSRRAASRHTGRQRHERLVGELRVAREERALDHVHRIGLAQRDEARREAETAHAATLAIALQPLGSASPRAMNSRSWPPPAG